MSCVGDDLAPISCLGCVGDDLAPISCQVLVMTWLLYHVVCW